MGPKREDVTREWRRLHNKELYDTYCSTNIIPVVKARRIRWTERAARMGDTRGAQHILMGRPDVKIPLGRPRRRWQNNIKMNLQKEWVREE